MNSKCPGVYNILSIMTGEQKNLSFSFARSHHRDDRPYGPSSTPMHQYYVFEEKIEDCSQCLTEILESDEVAICRTKKLTKIFEFPKTFELT